MNVLGFTNPAIGHLACMAPVARALDAAGNDVRIAVDASLGDHVEAAGLAAVPMATPPEQPAIVEERRVMTQDPRPLHERLEWFFRNWFASGHAYLPELLDVIDDVQPDVLLTETTAYGVMLAGELRGLPWVLADFFPPVISNQPPPDGWLTVLQESQRAVGLSPDPGMTMRQYLSVLVAPPGWFEPDRLGPTTHLLAPTVPPTPTALHPAVERWRSSAAGLPLVYCTLGTVFNGTPGVWDDVFAALGRHDVSVLATVGPDVDVDRNRRPGVVVESFIPHEHILPFADVVVAHGGFNSLTAALARGIPVVTIPLPAGDNITNAERVERLGAGTAVFPPDRTAGAIAEALGQVLDDPAFRERARSVAQRAHEGRSVDDVGTLFERLVATREPVLRRGT